LHNRRSRGLTNFATGRRLNGYKPGGMLAVEEVTFMRWLGCALATLVLVTGPVLAVPAGAQSGEQILDYHVDLVGRQS
jgi:hypothetical protein